MPAFIEGEGFAFSEGVDNEFHPNQGVFRTDAWLFGLGATLRF